MRRLLLLLLTLCCCGCAVFPTAQAVGNAPQTQFLSPIAIFADGTRVGLQFTQIGPEVYGSGLLKKGEATVKLNAVGLLQDGLLSVRLTPDTRTNLVRTLVIVGQLGGSGTWSDRVTGASGRLTLSGGEATSQRADGLPVPGTLQVNITSLKVALTCQVTQQIVRGVYSGTWTSQQQLGLPAATSGSFYVKVSDGHATMQLDQGAGVLSFPLGAPGQGSPLDADSDIVVDAGLYDDLTGTVTLAP